MPWLLLPSPKVLVVGSDEKSRDQAARLFTGPVEMLAWGVPETVPAARPELVLLFGADEEQIASCLAVASATPEEPPLVVVVAATPDLAAVAVAAGADEVLLATDSTALNQRRIARLLEVLACRQRDALARRLLDGLECGIVVTDATTAGYPIQHVNKSWERITGRDRTAVLGRSSSLLAGPNTDPTVVDEIARFAASGRKGRVVVRSQAGDGPASMHELVVMPLRNGARRVTHYVGVRHDVTDRHKVAELERHHESLEALVELRTRTLVSALEALEARGSFVETVLDAMTAGVLAVDASSAVTLANRAALQLLELTREECVGVPVLRLLQSGPEIMEAMASVLPGTEKRVDALYVTPSGRTVELGMSVIATRTSAVVGRPGFWSPAHSREGSGGADGLAIDRPLSFLFLFRDLGTQREFELELRRVNALTAVGQMAAGFAHEIRNPLAAIRSLSDNLLMELAQDDDRREYATRIVSLTRRLERFVKTSLRFAQPREPAPRPCGPRGLAEDALEVFAPRFNPGPAPPTLVADPAAPQVFVDPDQMVEVLVALVENALDVVEAPSHVRVLVEVVGPADGVDAGSCVAIEVADDGPGIPPELQARVFDAFFTTKPKGTGLGLSIVQRIVRNNGGHVRLQSRPGETRFRILLPVADL
ncbi:MAG: PAS domain-containing protein [Holophagales bacterium]|nr:PAS domain-containing protein [Holophagales bacterium]